MPVCDTHLSIPTVQRERHTTLSLFFLLFFSCLVSSPLSAGRNEYALSAVAARQALNELTLMYNALCEKDPAEGLAHNRYYEAAVTVLREKWLRSGDGFDEYKEGPQDPVRYDAAPLLATLSHILKRKNVRVVSSLADDRHVESVSRWHLRWAVAQTRLKSSIAALRMSHIVALSLFSLMLVDALIPLAADVRAWYNSPPKKKRRLSLVIRDALKKSTMAHLVHQVSKRCGFSKKKKRAHVQRPAPVHA